MKLREIMDICEQIFIDILERWNKRFMTKLPQEEIDLIDLAIRMTYVKTHTELKNTIISQCRIASNYKTNKSTINLSTLEFIINKL